MFNDSRGERGSRFAREDVHACEEGQRRQGGRDSRFTEGGEGTAEKKVDELLEIDLRKQRESVASFTVEETFSYSVELAIKNSAPYNSREGERAELAGDDDPALEPLEALVDEVDLDESGGEKRGKDRVCYPVPEATVAGVSTARRTGEPGLAYREREG